MTKSLEYPAGFVGTRRLGAHARSTRRMTELFAHPLSVRFYAVGPSNPTRSGLVACLDHLGRNDVLVVLDLDRLGRLAHDLLALIDGLEKRGVGFKAINSPMDTTTPAGRAFLQIQAAFAEMERPPAV